MTVAELLRHLHEMPPDLEVCTEGCDCWGDVGAVVVSDGVVLLKRSPSRA